MRGQPTVRVQGGEASRDARRVSGKQVWMLRRAWEAVCADRGWVPGDRAERLRVCGELLGRPLESFSSVGRLEECTRLVNGLRAMLGSDLQAGKEAADPSTNRRRVWLRKIAAEIVPCLERYGVEPLAYIDSMAWDKFPRFKAEGFPRPVRVTDLDARRILRPVNGALTESPGELEQVFLTLAARLDALRQEAGESVHGMKSGAGVPCCCARCRASVQA